MANMRLFILTIFVSVVSPFLVENIQTVHLYVSPSGSDSNKGHDHSTPLKTLHKAVALLNDADMANRTDNFSVIRTGSTADVVINLMSGYHDLVSTLNIQHSASRRVTFQAYNDQAVHVTGGKRLHNANFHTVTDQNILRRLPAVARSKVLQYRLSDSGITNLGKMSTYGFYATRTAPLEIFFNGFPLRLARWPNEEFVNVISLVDGQHGRRFTYAGDRPDRWAQEDDLWAYGYWSRSWADKALKIENITTSNNTITLVRSPPLHGLKVGHYVSGSADHTGQSNQDGGYYRIINALAELDKPGEYYVDRTSGILYLWPPSTDGRVNTQDVVYVSLIDDCIDLGSNSANIVFRGFSIEACRRNGITFASSTNMTFEELEIRNTGNNNIKFTGDCRNTVIQKCYLHDGDGGITMSGGDRKTLSPSNNIVNDNVIWRFSRETGVGSNAISLSGVGAHVHHNHMYIGQYTAIRWSGNDHVIEYNHIHHCCMNSSDCGAVHAGRDWTSRGNIIRKNHIHHNLKVYPGGDVRGIMLDDQYSSVTIDSNVFYDNTVHVNIGGGRDNIVRNNIFYNATKYSMQVDGRGSRHQNDRSLYNLLHSVPYKSGIWASRFPELAVIDGNHPEKPIGNEIYHNIFYDTRKEEIHFLIDDPNLFNLTDNGHASDPSQFYSPKHSDYRPRCLMSHYAVNVNFPVPVQLSQVGPRYHVGPSYLHFHHANSYVPPQSPGPCTTKAPTTTIPRSQYLPDGSPGSKPLFNVSKQGCWLHFEKCPLHSNLVSSKLFRDTDGEQHHQAAVSEAACLGRVPHYVQYCGNQSSFSVIYGPTGATTLGGEGCFFADYGCPKHGSPSPGRITRDGWAEQHVDGAHSEEGCLQRAKNQYPFCGSLPDYPITSVFRPTGHSVTAGYGCWIKVENCPSHPNQYQMFYDAWGATNMATDQTASACFLRAEDYWKYCGSHKEYPVTVYFRPKAMSKTYP